MAENQPLCMWSAPKVNHFQGSILRMSDVNFAIIHKLVSWDIMLTRPDDRHTDR